MSASASSPRPLDGYFFEDYRVGQRFRHATPRTITSGDVALYIALTGARQPLHCASTVAKALGYPDAPVDDLLVFHIAFGKTVPDISYNAVANLGYADCRFLQPVYVGDTIRCETEITGLKQNSNGKSGVVYVRSNAFNQRDENVLTWARWVMVHRRIADAPNATNAPVGQTDFASVAPDALHAPALANALTNMTLATGSNAAWEDFAAPELGSLQVEKIEPPRAIIHPAGMTIEESDHMLATRLYQNTARVHFDQHHMQASRFGRRLVYGGHVISICRALAYDGLENVLSIAAINGGTHHNPAFAGDTIYATSTPVAKWPLNAEIGAVRLLLSGYKNVDPASSAFPNALEDANKDAKILTLDYTVLMPRRTQI